MKTAKLLICSAFMLGSVSIAGAEELTPIEQLGKSLFFDQNLSTPPGQSCAACHAPETGFTGPISLINESTVVYPGAVHARFGNRKPPTAAYGGDSPVLYFDDADEDELWIGGMFWDGRATGWTLGDPLAEQALGPFLNNLEQNMPHAKQVIGRVAKSDYAPLFEAVYGLGSLNNKNDLETTYERIGRAIAAYERSAEVNPFTSKYDYYLKGGTLTVQEANGLALFEGKAQCSACHISEPGPKGEPPLFTDFTYDNLGIPKNPNNPFYSAPTSINRDRADWVDPGLAGFLSGAGYPEDTWKAQLGKQKVPTLRNVDKRPYPEFVKAYGHNGYFKSLEGIMHFYNTRDVKPECTNPSATEAEALAQNCWPSPEVSENVNTDELGNLGLTAEEEAAIVAFMKTLSDGYTP